MITIDVSKNEDVHSSNVQIGETFMRANGDVYLMTDGMTGDLRQAVKLDTGELDGIGGENVRLVQNPVLSGSA